MSSSRRKTSDVHVRLGFNICRAPDGSFEWLMQGNDFHVRLPIESWKQSFWETMQNWFDSHYSEIEYPLKSEVWLWGEKIHVVLRADTDLLALCGFLKNPVLLMAEGNGGGSTARQILAALESHRRADGNGHEHEPSI